jgi:hypothetical protein
MFSPKENVHSEKVMARLREMGYFIWELIEEDPERILQEGMEFAVNIRPIAEGEGIHGRAMLLASTARDRFTSFHSCVSS